MPGDKTLGPSQRATLQKAMALDVPASGRQGEPPEWPLPAKLNEWQANYWRYLWSLPVACAWEHLQIPPQTVARYVVAYVQSITDHQWTSAVARLERDLGLTPEAMTKMKIRVVGDDGGAAQEAERQSDVAYLDDVRKRLTGTD